MIRRRYFRVGVMRGEWWIGARRAFVLDGIQFNLFGLSIVVYDELWCELRGRWTRWRARQRVR